MRLRDPDAVRATQVFQGDHEVMPADPSPDDEKWIPRHAGMPVRAGRQAREAYKFGGGDTWLRDLSFVLLNRTSKVIAYVQLDMIFPQASAVEGGAGVLVSARFGDIPRNVAFTGSGEPLRPGFSDQALTPLCPGCKVRLSLRDFDPRLREAIGRFQAFEVVSVCRLHFIVYFDDGMQWNDSGYFRPVEGQPGKFEPMPFDYFPCPIHDAGREGILLCR
jgi:hypothetical protein